MSRKSELQTAVERLDVKISIIEMQLNSASNSKWPDRKQWRGLLKLANEVVAQYEKENKDATQ